MQRWGYVGAGLALFGLCAGMVANVASSHTVATSSASMRVANAVCDEGLSHASNFCWRATGPQVLPPGFHPLSSGLELQQASGTNAPSKTARWTFRFRASELPQDPPPAEQLKHLVVLGQDAQGTWSPQPVDRAQIYLLDPNAQRSLVAASLVLPGKYVLVYQD